MLKALCCAFGAWKAEMLGPQVGALPLSTLKRLGH